MANFYGGSLGETIAPWLVSPTVIRIPAGSFPGAAADVIYGGGGNDYLVGDSGNDSIYGGADNDLIYGGIGADTINGGAGNDSIYGGSGNDVLRGGGGTDIVYGGANNDTIYSSGYGSYYGGSGNDYVYAAAGGVENLRGGAGTDWLNTTHWNSNYSINLSTGVTNYAGESFLEFENLIAGGGSDTLVGTNGANIIYGGAGNDSIDGRLGNDVLYGGAGNDVLRGGGGGGTDTVYGGGNNDTIYSSGNGSYYGGSGNDYVYAAAGGVENLRGGAGTDWLNTTHWNANYSINLGTGATNYVGESFLEFENLVAGGGSDTLVGTNGANSIYGGSGNDVISGLGGADRLFGGSGNDVLRGGTAADLLYGGAGSDTFDFNLAAESGGAFIDRIVGFDGAGLTFFGAPNDRIDVSGIDANASLLFNQAFAFYGERTDAQGLALGPGALWVRDDGADTLVRGNTAAGNPIELTIRIQDGAGTDASDYWSGDFVL